MKTNQKISVLFYLNRKKLSNDGKAPIYVRVTIDSHQKENSLSLKCKPSEWDGENKKVLNSNTQAKNINSRLEQAKASIERLFLVLGAQHDYVTPFMLINAFKSPKKLEVKNEDKQKNEGAFNELKERIDKAAKEAFSYFAEVKKAKKIKNEMARNTGWPNLIA